MNLFQVSGSVPIWGVGSSGTLNFSEKILSTRHLEILRGGGGVKKHPVHFFDLPLLLLVIMNKYVGDIVLCPL